MDTTLGGSLSPRPEPFPNPSPFHHTQAQAQVQQVQAQVVQQTATPLFDYANFSWDGRDTWQQMILDVGREINFDPNAADADFGPTQTHDLTSLATQAAAIRAAEMPPAHNVSDPASALSDDTSPHANAELTGQNAADNHRLINYFTHAVTPPILSEVEAQKN